MFITCPSCATRYEIDAHALGTERRTVRCFRCGNQWLHEPPSAAPGPAAPTAPPPPPPPEPEARAVPQPLPVRRPQPVPRPEPEAPPQPEAAAEAEPAPQPEAEPEPEREAEPKAESEPEPEPEPERIVKPEVEIGRAPHADEEDEEKDEEAAAPSETAEEGAAAPPAEIEAEAAPDEEIHEPIPESLTSPEPQVDPAQRKKRVLIAALVPAFVVLGFVAVLLLARGPIVAALPGAAKLYTSLGITVEPLGAGLDIRRVKSERSVENGTDVLLVHGVVANVSKEARDVPLIRISLYDAGSREIQYMVVTPDKTRLPAGQDIDFKARMENPAATARRLEVTFTRDDKTSKG